MQPGSPVLEKLVLVPMDVYKLEIMFFFSY